MNSDLLLKLESLSKSFPTEAGSGINVLAEISFYIKASERGTITSVLAPFGSGKSTLLKIISGIINPSGGVVSFGDNNKIIPLIPEKPSSFPWLSVRENIEFALGLTNQKKYNLNQLVSLVGLSGYEDHFPNNKSIGFRFRISLARALAVNPILVCVDDSFRMMNEQSRYEIFDLILALSSHQKQNFILTTTNLIEAVYLSDKILLMSKKPLKIIKEIEISADDKVRLRDLKSEKFTKLKTEIEGAFEDALSITTINYTV